MSRTRRVSLISLGCPKNLVDSEGIVSGLLSNDVEVVQDPADADVVLVNTCGFLGSARDESLATIRKVTELKERGLRGVVVTGCMIGNYRDQIMEAVPDVDHLVDFADYRRIPELVDGMLPERPPADGFRPGVRVQARLTPAHFAYLKISEGCNHTCSFCVIPKIRGRMKSVPFEELLERGRRLVELGARELDVIAQDSTLYGTDMYGKRRIGELLRGLADIDGARWVRLLYAYPTEVDDDLVETLAADNDVLPYMDVPLQHTSDRMLELMKRRSSEADVENLMSRLRDRVPDMAIRTTFIVGFPGETEADHEHMLAFVERHRLERLGAFTWSPEEGSTAWDLPQRVPEDVQQERYDRLMSLQHRIATAHGEEQVGRTLEVLIDDPGADGVARGRSRMDAPEIDGTVFVRGRPLAAGEMVDVRIDSAEEYDLHGTVIEE